MNGTWYIGTMNDGLFIIDQPPQPAPVDYTCGMNHDLNVIAAMGNDKARTEAIVAAHNEAIRTLKMEQLGINEQDVWETRQNGAGLGDY